MYYSIAGQKVAMYDGTDVVYFLTDHLGSTVGVLDDTGTDINILLEENRYTPFGEVRDITGSLDPITETDFGYTGQRDLDSIGLMDYNARFYSPALGRFIQPDKIVPNPENPQSLNRYSYAYNNPCNATDPSGHMPLEFSGKSSNEDCGKMEKGGNSYWLKDVGRTGLFHARRLVEKGEIYRGMDSTSVAAGIVVQSEWYLPIIDTHTFIGDSDTSGYGYAQMGDKELSYFGFSPKTNDRPELAPLLMGVRLQRVISVAEGRFGKDNLSELDYFFLLALGQNYSYFGGKNGDPAFQIDPSNKNHTLMGDEETGPRWDIFIPNIGGSGIAKIREFDTKLKYSQISIIEYGYALIELEKAGHQLPYGLDTTIVQQGIDIACGNLEYP